MKNGKWTIDCIKEEALKYTSRKEFAISSCGAYNAARRLGIIDQVCCHMDEKIKKRGYWTKERILKVALKYSSKKTFEKESSGAYNAARRYGILQEVTDHMHKKRMPNNYWTPQRIQEEARRYTCKKDFREKSPKASRYANELGIMDTVSTHFIESRKPNGYWTPQRIQEEAKNHETRSEFEKAPNGAYAKARQLGIIDQVCSHMFISKNLSKRCIYVCIFPDKHAYIGLTWSLKSRNKFRQRQERDAVTMYHVKSGLDYQTHQLTDFVDVKQAKKIEQYYIDLYESYGWKMLNRAKAGALGSYPAKWTKRNIQLEALKFSSRRKFFQNSKSAYNRACELGILDEVCSHMKTLRKPNGYWSLEKLKYIALRFNSRTEFLKTEACAYTAARTLGVLEEITRHMEYINKPLGYWSKITINEVAKKYSTRTMFAKNANDAYCAARRQGILEEVCQHMDYVIKPRGYWTKDKVIDEALKYRTQKEFRDNNRGAHEAAYRLGIFEEATKHLKKRKPSGYWNKQNIKKEAMKYHSKREFQTSNKSAYNAAVRQSFLNELYILLGW
ncbi:MULTISPECIES: hypothetical protein [unclassified Carboxylicivirga]|uniref:hypothetical protein n=1 Tax=Carboxylicivirga TaxID=1628153 RepID=UPI003D34365E